MTHIEASSDHLQSRSEIELLRGANQRISNHLDWLTGQVKAKAVTVAVGPVTLAREEVTALLEETAAKILSVGHLHHSLAEQPTRLDVNLCDYVASVCSTLISSLALESRISVVNRTMPNCMVSSEQAQIIGLMVSEILMNAVKYAHPTGILARITVACSNQGDGRLVLSVRDDGVGLPEGMDGNSQGGTGLKLIRSLASSLDADLHIESDSLGLAFAVEFPTRAAAGANKSVSAANVRQFPK